VLLEGAVREEASQEAVDKILAFKVALESDVVGYLHGLQILIKVGVESLA